MVFAERGKGDATGRTGSLSVAIAKETDMISKACGITNTPAGQRGHTLDKIKKLCPLEASGPLGCVAGGHAFSPHLILCLLR
jgi:hypothetical protein